MRKNHHRTTSISGNLWVVVSLKCSDRSLAHSVAMLMRFASKTYCIKIYFTVTRKHFIFVLPGDEVLRRRSRFSNGFSFTLFPVFYINVASYLVVNRCLVWLSLFVISSWNLYGHQACSWKYVLFDGLLV